jgi:cell division protein FtsB
MKWILVVLLLLFGLLQHRLWFGDGSLREVWQLQERIAAQQAENALLKARNERLAARVRDLKQGLDTVEGIARRELGMIRKDETFYQLLED